MDRRASNADRWVAGALFAAIVALSGPAAGGRQSGADADLLPAIARYRAWTRVNSEPYRIAPEVNALCAPAKSIPASPHAGAYIDVYVNDTGRAAMLTKGDVTFPLGTVIVKEKRAAERSPEPTLLTVMVKREAGYNPAVGDWEFAVVDGAAARVEERGRLASCMRCHSALSRSDFVFRSYLDASGEADRRPTP